MLDVIKYGKFKPTGKQKKKNQILNILLQTIYMNFIVSEYLIMIYEIILEI